MCISFPKLKMDRSYICKGKKLSKYYNCVVKELKMISITFAILIQQ